MFLCSVFIIAVELCQRIHVVTANNYTNGTVITYKNSESSEESIVTFQGQSLPSLSICGNSFKRCNLHITSNYNGSI